jgi:hypothetical protein
VTDGPIDRHSSPLAACQAKPCFIGANARA